MDGTVLEQISEAVHNGWMEAKKAKGITSRKLDTTGEELLRPYAEFSEEAKDLDRGTVRSVLDALPRAGFVLVPGGVAQVPVDAQCTKGQL